PRCRSIHGKNVIPAKIRRKTHHSQLYIAWYAACHTRLPFRPTHRPRPAPMSEPDFNLLAALDALLAEGSVAGAARRTGLSTSAMSRTLGRLRATTGDPLLVRAGRHMVPTPHAQAIR